MRPTVREGEGNSWDGEGGARESLLHRLKPLGLTPIPQTLRKRKRAVWVRKRKREL